MPLQHVQNQRRSPARAPETPAPETEVQEEGGFQTAFAPPPAPVGSVTEAATRPDSGIQQFAPPPSAPIPQTVPQPAAQQTFYTAPMPTPAAPTDVVKILSPLDNYRVGSNVPASCFPEIERLLRLGVVQYTYETATSDPVDGDLATAMKLAQPIAAARGSGVPRAPFAQATVRDILGPAIRGRRRLATVNQPAPGYSFVPAEHGVTLVVADPMVQQTVTAAGSTLTPEQMQAGAEAILRDPNLNAGKAT